MNDEVSLPITALWAKSPGEGQRPLPLMTHLRDACEVATVYWESFASRRFRDALTAAVGGDEARALRVIRWLAAAHDTGKATPAFAGQVPALRPAVEAAALPLLADPDANRRLRHDLAGAVLWYERLRRRDWSRDTAEAMSLMIAGHHGTYPDAGAWNDAMSDTSCTGRRHEAWGAVQQEVMDQVEAIAGITAADFEALARRQVPVALQLELEGLLIHSDWIASDANRFPLGRADGPGVPDGRDSRQRAEAAWSDLALPGPWHPRPDRSVADDLYRARFGWPEGRGTRAVQQRALELARSASPGLMVIEAPMGVGKTETALAVAEEWGARSGCSGVYFALPTMATSDAMFERVLSWVDRVPGTGRVSVFLAHSKRPFNRRFEALSRSTARRSTTHDDEDDHDDGAHLSVAQWLTGKRRGIAANIVVGTVDHVLMLALRSRFGALRHAALAGKVVVVDEVHASDARMLFFLERSLEWLAASGVPVVLLSATLTSAIRERLIAGYERGVLVRRAPRDEPVRASSPPAVGPAAWTVVRPRRDPSGGRDQASADLSAPDPSTPPRAPVVYPLITLVDGEGRRSDAAPSSAGALRATVQVQTLGDEVSDLLDLLRSRTDEGGCVLVVRNTVRRANELYDAIRDDPDLGGDVTLAHSRFIGPHRAENDEALVERFGPPADDRERPGRVRPAIVVATQVAEMSLDVDFDLLVTDLAPVDAVLQRIGRLHRHARAHRPVPLAEPRCVLTGVVDWASAPIDPERGSTRVYGRAALLRAALVLEPHLGHGARPLRLPDDIGDLVEAASRPDLPAPASWGAALSEADAQANRVRAESEHRATPWRVSGVEETDSLMAFTHGGIDDRAEQLGLATVRDGEDSFEVILLRPGDGEGTRTTMPTSESPGGCTVDVNFEPDPATARTIAAGAVRLPSWLCVAATGDRVIAALERTRFAAWDRNPYLRGQLLLDLDVDGRAVVDDFELRYTRERGLEIARR